MFDKMKSVVTDIYVTDKLESPLKFKDIITESLTKTSTLLQISLKNKVIPTEGNGQMCEADFFTVTIPDLP